MQNNKIHTMDSVIVNGTLLNPLNPKASFYQEIEKLSEEGRNETFKKDYLTVREYYEKAGDNQDVFHLEDEMNRIVDKNRMAVTAHQYLAQEQVEDLNYSYDDVAEKAFEEAEIQRIEKIAKLCRIDRKYLNPQYF